MAKAIGLRVYRITAHARGSSDIIPLDSPELKQGLPSFISNFVKFHNIPTQDIQLERSWHFESKSNDDRGNCSGYIHYGTFGFESNFVDAKTKKKQYKRKISDVEEIPLYFDFWFPENSEFGFMAMQSFQGRSCVNLLSSKIRDLFERENKNYIISFRKIMPNDAKGSAYYNAPVQQLTLIKKKVYSDVADKYFKDEAPDLVNISVSMSARRAGSLGSLRSLLSSISNSENSVILYDGLEFPEAVAAIRVGKRLRRVGVLGPNTDAGVIDLSDFVRFGTDGHPTFESLKKESDSILQDFYDTLVGIES